MSSIEALSSVPRRSAAPSPASNTTKDSGGTPAKPEARDLFTRNSEPRDLNRPQLHHAELKTPASSSFSATAVQAKKPGERLETARWPAQHAASNPNWGPALTDIVRHLPTSYRNTYFDPNRMTYGHETSHGIHSDLRNHQNPTSNRVNAFYLLNDKAAFIREPNTRKRHAAEFIPSNLRGSRFDTYVEGSLAWDDTPTYLLDEWNAYINGGAIGTELVRLGKWNEPWQDGVMGQLEFNTYAIATAMAVEKHDPDYWSSADGEQLREFLAYNLKRSMDIYREGSTMEAFKWDKGDNYLKRFQTSDEAKKMRDFLQKNYGGDFTQRVFGFGGDAPAPAPIRDPRRPNEKIPFDKLVL